MHRILVMLIPLVAAGLAGCTSDDGYNPEPWDYDDSGSFVVQDGDHVAFMFTATAPGSLDIEMTVTSGPAVDVYVMLASSYRQYQRDQDQENTVFYAEGGACTGTGRTRMDARCNSLSSGDWVIVFDNAGDDTDQQQGTGGTYPAVSARGPASIDYDFSGGGG